MMSQPFQSFKTLLLLVMVILACLPHAQAKGQYLSQDEFLKQVFPTSQPVGKNLWLRGQLKQDVKSLLGHDYSKLRVKYWQQGETTTWILEQIGKVKPITAGFVVKSGEIQHTAVLAFRESRGWEVKRKAFTRQFEFTRLTPDNRLSQHIDGITGATLSVSAMTRMARLALRLHQEVQQTLGSDQ